MSSEETFIRMTFPPGPLSDYALTEKTVRVEFGALSVNHLKLAMLLMFDYTLGGKEEYRELCVESFEEVVTKLKGGKGKSALQLFKEMMDE